MNIAIIDTRWIACDGGIKSGIFGVGIVVVNAGDAGHGQRQGSLQIFIAAPAVFTVVVPKYPVYIILQYTELAAALVAIAWISSDAPATPLINASILLGSFMNIE